MDNQILLYYKYTPIEDPQELWRMQKEICRKLGLKGRIIVSKEGINGTVEGLKESTEEYIKFMQDDERFADTHFKKSSGDGSSFPKLSVKLRDELVSGHLSENDVDVNVFTGKYLTAEELHTWIQEGKRFFIVDMRNDYEHKIGYFKDSLLAPFSNFRDLPKILPILEPIKGEVIVTVCTGGVRCEKASGFLVKNGFLNVYQLYGGIVTYMEMYPNEDFLGKLYVFDGRVAIGFNTDSPDHIIVSKCEKCGATSDNYIDCEYIHCEGKRHFISCESCIEKDGRFCELHKNL